MKPGDRVKVSDLQLGDIVCLTEGAEYSHATVYQCQDNGDRKLWRPYIHVGDVEYADHRLIPYIGCEDFKLYSDGTVILRRRGGPTR